MSAVFSHVGLIDVLLLLSVPVNQCFRFFVVCPLLVGFRIFPAFLVSFLFLLSVGLENLHALRNFTKLLITLGQPLSQMLRKFEI